GGGRNVTMTLPDGRRTTFAFDTKEGGTSQEPCSCYEARWLAAPGVYAGLGARDRTQINYLPGSGTFPPFWEAAGPLTPFENFDFSGFYLTNEDGSIYEIVREYVADFDLDDQTLKFATAYGTPRVSRVIARSGEFIEIALPVPPDPPPNPPEPPTTRQLVNHFI